MRLGQIHNLGDAIKLEVTRGNTAIADAEGHYKAAGTKLIEAKAHVTGRNDITWLGFLKHCGIGKSRAYQLSAIAKGEITLADIRAANRVRDFERRQRQKSVAHGNISDNAAALFEGTLKGYAALGLEYQNRFLAANDLVRLADVQRAE